LKASAGDELLDAVRHVLKGDYFLSPAMGSLSTLMSHSPISKQAR
jgi:hypothetical protein